MAATEETGPALATVGGPVAPAGEYGRIAGFWIRVAADFLDAVILWGVGALLSLPLRSLFLRLGENGVFIGLALSLVYAGVLQSRIGGGQTLAKRLLGLKVIKLDGSLLSLDRSLIRYATVSFMVYQGSVCLALVRLLPFLRIQWVEIVAGTLSLVLFLGCVLVVPFHPLKRGLHDLLVGSIVVRRGAPVGKVIDGAATDGRDRIIVISAATLFVVSTVISFGLARPAARLPADVAHPERLTLEVPLQNAGVTDSLELGTQGRRRTVIVSGFLPTTPDGAGPDFTGAEKRLLEALRRQISDDSDIDNVGTSLRTGFNIGIRSSYETHVRIENRKTGSPVSTTISRSF